VFIREKLWSPARNPIKIKNNPSRHSHFTPLPGRPCGADFFYNFWHVVSYHRRNHACEILSQLVKGLRGHGSPKSWVSHWLWMSLIQQRYALTCYTVIPTTEASSTNRGCFCTAVISCILEVQRMWIKSEYLLKPSFDSYAWKKWCQWQAQNSCGLNMCLVQSHAHERMDVATVLVQEGKCHRLQMLRLSSLE